MMPIDARTVALFRMSIALALLLELRGAWPDKCTMYSADGLLRLPSEEAHGGDSCDYTGRVFMVHMLAGVLLLCGACARASALVAWLLQLSLMHRNPDVQTADAALLCVCLLWTSLLPSSERWSVDAALSSALSLPSPRDKHLRKMTVGALGLQLHVALFYLTSVAIKVAEGRHPMRLASLPSTSSGAPSAERGASPWLDGSAVAEALICCEYQRPIGKMLSASPRLCAAATYLTLAVEALAPIALLVLDGAPRLAALFALWSLHLAMHACLALGNFSIICAAALSIFVPAELWHGLLGGVPKGLRHREDELPATGEPSRGGVRARAARAAAVATNVCACALILLAVCASIDAVAGAYAEHTAEGEAPWAAASLSHGAAWGRALGLPARFDMFAPPPNECGWLVAPALLRGKSGLRVDAFRLHKLRGHRVDPSTSHADAIPRDLLQRSRVTYAPPAFLATQHSLLWHRLFEQLADQHAEQSGDARRRRTRVAAYLCRQHPELVRLEMIFVAEVYAFGSRAPHLATRERRQIWEGACAASEEASGEAGWEASGESSGEVSGEASMVGGRDDNLELFHSRVPLDTWRVMQLDVHHGPAGEPSRLSTSSGEIVMARDEEPYMHALASALTEAGGTGRVLEIGFGLGLSARHLTALGVRQHVVIEPNHGVFNASLVHAFEVAPRTAFTPVLGFWQEVSPQLRTAAFDGILFDAFPDAADESFFREARRLLRPGGVLTFFHSVCDSLGGALAAAECGPWADRVEKLRAAGWTDAELPSEEPPTLVLDIENTCAATQGVASCGMRPRTFATPIVRRALATDGADGDGTDAAHVPGPASLLVDPPEDRQALEEAHHRTRLQRMEWTPSRAEWQTAHPKQEHAGGAQPPLPPPLSHPLSDPFSSSPPQPSASLVIEGAMVMGVDEAAHMAKLASTVMTSHDNPKQRHGIVLEVGFGLGLSAAAIQEHGAREHHIIEANIDITRALLASNLAMKRGVRPLLGFWQEMVPCLADASYDSILFDPFPNDDEARTTAVVHQRKFMRHAHRLLRPGGVFVYMSGGADEVDIARDRAAALAAGFAPDDVHISKSTYTMTQACKSYPRCELVREELLLTRLVKAGGGVEDQGMGSHPARDGMDAPARDGRSVEDPTQGASTHPLQAAATAATTAAVPSTPAAPPACDAQLPQHSLPHSKPECLAHEVLLDYLEESLLQGRMYLPDGPVVSPAPLPDVIEDTSGALSTLPVFDVAAMTLRTSTHAQMLQRMLSVGAPFVLRNHEGARRLMRDAAWSNPIALCEAHAALCDTFGMHWSWAGGQMNYHDRRYDVDSAWGDALWGPNRTRVESQTMAHFLLGTSMSTVPVSASGAADPGAVDRRALSSSWTGPIKSCDEAAPSGGLSRQVHAALGVPEAFKGLHPEFEELQDNPPTQVDEQLGLSAECRLRFGRPTYASNLHVDFSSNWILAVKGAKRAIVVHPYASECLQVVRNQSLDSFRQSLMPLTRAREWLAEHCPPGEVAQPIALQHRFKEGDLMYIPGSWVHSVDNAPTENGWWISLNRFAIDAHSTNEHICHGCRENEKRITNGHVWPAKRPWLYVDKR